MLRVVQPRDPNRQPDVFVVPRVPSGPSPFDATLPSGTELAEGAELSLTPFDEPTESTPVTAVSPWQRQTPPALPKSEDG